MEFWHFWEEISRVMAVLCLITALAAVTAAGILFVREKLSERTDSRRSAGGRRAGIIAALAVGVWLLVLGRSASAAETGSAPAEQAGEGGTESESAASGDTSGAGTETAPLEEPEEDPDLEAPAVSIRMAEDAGRDSEGTLYCRKDNAGFLVLFEDGRENDSGVASCRVCVTGPGGEVIRREWEAGESETEEALFDSAEIAELADGEIEVAAEAYDRAGNYGCCRITFVLDTVSPLLVQAATFIEEGGEESGIPEKRLYGGRDLYYNAAGLTTRFRIEEKNQVHWTVAYSAAESLEEDGASGCRVRQISGEGCEGLIAITEEGVYGDWVVDGEDTAGNRIMLSEDCILTQDTADAFETEEGIALPRRKILDRTSPVAQIAFRCTKTGFSYADKRGAEIYYGGDVEVTLSVLDRCGKGKMPMDRQDHGFLIRENEQVREAEADRYVMKKDSRIQFGACGADRAGNPLVVLEDFVSEIIPVQGAAPESALRPDAEGRSFGPHIVRDTVNPQVEASMKVPEGNPAAVDPENGIVYYGGQPDLYEDGAAELKVCFTVSDQNIDEGRLQGCLAYAEVPEGACCEQVEPDLSGYQSLPCTAEKVPAEDPAPEEAGKAEDAGPDRIRLTICRRPGSGDTPDGVYRIGIQGADKAGNPLIPGAAGRSTGVLSSLTAGTGDQTAGLECTDTGRGTCWTGRKVVDTRAPAGEVLVMNGDGEVYGRWTSHTRGWVRDQAGFMPYRREKEAFAVFSASDSSPSGVSARLLSSAGGRNEAPPGGGRYSFGGGETVRLRGGQVFRLENVLFRDRAGNEALLLPRTVNFYLDTRIPDADLTPPAAVVRAVPAITSQAPDGRGLYAGGVRIRIEAEDRDRIHGASGIREIRYEVRVGGSVVREGVFRPEQSPSYRLTGEIDLPSGGLWESNDIEVEATAEDNAGNRSDPVRGGLYRLGIDTKGPEVTVRYDNNEARNGRYFDKARKVRITVRERNFDRTALQVLAPGAPAGEWKRRSGTGSEEEWIMDIPFAADGEYTLLVSGTDALGNPASVQYQGEAPQAFVIDRTPPGIQVIWDNTDVRNGRYYNRARRALVRITELSFDGRGVRMLPLSRPFRKISETPAGKLSVYEAEIPFTEEGEWLLYCACTDLAGNSAVPFSEEPFVIDCTAPKLYFDRDTVLEMGAYGGKIEPVLRIEDENPARQTCSASWFNRTAGGTVMEQSCAGSTGDTGSAVLRDPPEIRDADGVCVLSGTACDLAGNRAFVRRRLCVNRFGSLYDVTEDAATREMVSGKNTDGQSPLVVTEYNVSPLVSRQITIYRGSAARILAEGGDYSVTEVMSPAGVRYVYRIDPAVFSDEGRYRILIESEDEAGGHNASPGRFTGGAGYSPEWTVDRTPPEVRVTGVDTRQHRFLADEVQIGLVPTDNLDLRRLTVRITDDRGRVIREWQTEREQLLRILEENGGQVPVSVRADRRWQNLEAVAEDGAGLTSVGMAGCDGPSYRVLVSENPLVHLYGSGILPAAAFLALVAAIRFAYSVYKRTLA